MIKSRGLSLTTARFIVIDYLIKITIIKLLFHRKRKEIASCLNEVSQKLLPLKNRRQEMLTHFKKP